MKIVCVVLLICAIQVNELISQEEFCLFDTFMTQRIQQDVRIQIRLDSIQRDIWTRMKAGKQTRNRSVVTIPVVVHVVWKREEDNLSTERIYAQIQMLNDVFNSRHPDIETIPPEFKAVIGNPSLNFCLAVIDPIGNPTNGILRVKTDIDRIGATDSLFFTEQGGSTAWDTKKYLNIWITAQFGNTGYAFPPENGDPSRDGVVLSARVVDIGNEKDSHGNGRVCVHEIGHYLGLRHIWGNDLYAEDPQCLNDDGFSDTPPQWRYSHRCPDEHHPPPFSCDHFNMYVNFMDYTPDKCLSMFTQQQVDYMLSILDVYRPELNSNNTDCFNFSSQMVEYDFNIYPNPTNTHLTLSFDSVGSIFTEINVYNLNGIHLWNYEDLLFDGIEIDLPAFSQGVYFIKIGNSIQKLIIL